MNNIMFYLRGSESSPCPPVQFVAISLIFLKRFEKKVSDNNFK